MEYERARFACRQGPEKCPLIGRCDKNRCQAALPCKDTQFMLFFVGASLSIIPSSFVSRHVCLQQPG